MKILCAYSGIEFSCEHFPASLYSRETSHPIFNIPQKKLLSYMGKWATLNALTPTDSYLLFLALLKSTDLVDFRVPVERTEQTNSIIATNMEALAKTVSRLNTVYTPSVVFPRYVISPDTRTLANIHFWIENWNDTYQDFLDGYRSTHESQKLIQREHALERMIKNPHKPISSIAPQLAEWAALAGSFPVFLIKSPFTGMNISCSDYWKIIISKCANEESIFSIRRKDIEELLEHCEEFIPVGSIFSNALFKTLRHALERQRNFLGLGDLDIGRTISYKILEETDSIESANIQAMIASAPDHCPDPKEYPNKLLYLKAKMRWEMAQRYKGNDGAESTESTNGENNAAA